MNEEEKKANAANDPIQNLQYKIQYIIPNTFTNKESIAHKDSLHNQLKKNNDFPQLFREGGLLITSPNYLVQHNAPRIRIMKRQAATRIFSLREQASDGLAAFNLLPAKCWHCSLHAVLPSRIMGI